MKIMHQIQIKLIKKNIKIMHQIKIKLIKKKEKILQKLIQYNMVKQNQN